MSALKIKTREKKENKREKKNNQTKNTQKQTNIKKDKKSLPIITYHSIFVKYFLRFQCGKVILYSLI